ncbi:Neprilysin-2 [Harpegnathos saltator]|uniref:Neprilysin-2 n=1 Tax=Harpegnathos saltator TaxID=610380 RepID=E2C2S1_HARSA|nr:Neprilysin-2 [Harpegnathos saltator]
MPCRQTYEVNKRQLNKAAQRDQSYRNCLGALLIFFFLCLILILACIPWKTRNQGRYSSDEYSKYDSQYHHGEPIKGSTTTTTTTATTTATITEATLTGIKDVIIIENSTIPWKKDEEGSDTHESYKEGKTQNKVTVSTEKIFKPNDEDYSTEKGTESLEYITEQLEEGKGATTNKDISVAPRQTVLTSPSGTITTSGYSSDEYHSSQKSELGIVTDDITTSTSSTQSADHTTSGTTVSTSEYVELKIKDITQRNVTSSTLSTRRAEEITTDKYSSSEYHSSEKSELDMTEDATANPTDGYLMSEINDTTDNITHLTSSTRSTDLEENSTGIHEISKASVAAVTSTMTPSTDLEESTSVEHSYDEHHYPQESQSVVTIIYRTAQTTTAATTRFDPEEDEHTGYSTDQYLNQEKESTGYDETSVNNDDVITGSSLVTEDYTPSLNKDSPATTDIINEAENTTYVTTSARSQSKNAETFADGSTVVTTEKSSTYNYTSAFNSSTSSMSRTNITSFYNNMTTTVSPLPDEEKDICNTEHCKRIASKMLSYMNHLVDPCDDFYEYACGGFEANPQLVDTDLMRQSNNYQRIARQMVKEKRENIHSPFATYYDSCVQYERTVNFNERVEMGKLWETIKYLIK